MKIVQTIFLILTVSLLSCRNDANIVEVPAGRFTYVPLKNWTFAFDQYEFDEDYKIYTAAYEVKSKRLDTTVAVVYIHAQYIDNEDFGCDRFERADLFPLQKAFQKKYGLKDPDLCTMIDTKKLIYCDSETRIDFGFQNEDIFIQCFMNIILDQSKWYDETELLDDFDTFIRSFNEL